MCVHPKEVTDMKKTLLTLVAAIFLFNLPFTAYASVPKPVDKFTKGMVEVIKSPLVIIDHTKKSMDSSEHKPVGLFKGLLESPFHFVKSAGHGALDMVTCPIE
jgi:hypothetical protein